jgi:hypothetical protein
MRITIGCVTIEAGSEKEMEIAFSYVERVASLASQYASHAPQTALGRVSTGKPPIGAPTDYCAEWVASSLNREAKGQFRSTREETAKYGDKNLAAYSRLREAGLCEPYEAYDQALAGKGEQGVTFASELDLDADIPTD